MYITSPVDKRSKYLSTGLALGLFNDKRHGSAMTSVGLGPVMQADVNTSPRITVRRSELKAGTRTWLG